MFGHATAKKMHRVPSCRWLHRRHPGILPVDRAIYSGATVVFGPMSLYVERANGTQANLSHQRDEFVMPCEEVSGTNGNNVGAINAPSSEMAMDYTYGSRNTMKPLSGKISMAMIKRRLRRKALA